MSPNQAAWLDAPGKPFRIADAEIPSPGPNEVVIRNRAVAINPIDAVQAETGLLLSQYPVVLGHDLAGTIREVGSAVSKFKQGDRVIAHAWSMVTKDSRNAAFALFSKVQAGVTSVLPDGIEFRDGTVLPVALSTAVAGLYQEIGFGLPFPREAEVSDPIGKLAKVSGVRIIAIASPRNNGLCTSLGASEVFDQKSASLVEDIVGAIRASGDDFIGVFDAISEADTYAHSYEILDGFGGGRLVIVHPAPENVPENVQCQMIFALGDFCFPLWEEFVPEALLKGLLKPLPEPLVIGHGLESLQKGCERMREGVSARKIVVEL